MAVRLQTKLRWFDLGAAAFESQSPGVLSRQFGEEHPPMYVCPVCARCFTRDAVERGDLTEEHVPPESLGGRGLLLTCRKCNNDGGAHLDSHARKRQNIVEVMQGKTTISRTVKVRIGEQLIVNAKITGGEGGWQIHLAERHNPPGTIDAFKAQLDTGEREITFDFPRDRYVPFAAKVSWLRSAYLVLVAFGGYRVVLDPAMRIVRRQLTGPKTQHIPRFLITKSESIPLTQRRVLVVKEPSPERCVVVQFGSYCVALPNPGDLASTPTRLARALDRLDPESPTPAETETVSHTIRTNTAENENGRPERSAVTH